jgi:hypothetical protein
MSAESEPIDREGLRRAVAQLQAAGLTEAECRDFCLDALTRARPRRTGSADVPSPAAD